MNSNIINKEASTPEFAVALPCEPDQFSQFISGLLGKPQTISKTYSGSFELVQHDIEDVYNLLTQRISQQNQGSLIQFTVRLVFDDNSTVLLNSLEDYLSYTETRPLVATQVHLSWTFLVKFQDKDHPEKQEIDLSFVTRGIANIAVFDSEDSPVIPLSRIIGGGQITFRVAHTARTWGADIESLLSGHVKHLLLPEGKARGFVRKHSGKISLLLGVLFFVCSVAACIYSAGQISQEQFNLLKPILNDPSALDQKINMLLEFMISGFWGKFFFSVFVFSIFSLFFAILLVVWAETSADARKPSYLLLTKRSHQDKAVADRKYQSKWYSFFSSIFVGTVTGVIANIIFTTYWLGQ